MARAKRQLPAPVGGNPTRQPASILMIPLEIKVAILDVFEPLHRSWYSPDEKKDLIAMASISREWRQLVVPRLFKKVTIPEASTRRRDHDSCLAWTRISSWIKALDLSGVRADLSFAGHVPRLDTITLDFESVERGYQRGGAWHTHDQPLDPVCLLHGLDAPALRSLHLENCQHEDHPGAIYSVSRWLPTLLRHDGVRYLTTVHLDYGHDGGFGLSPQSANQILVALAKLKHLRDLRLDNADTRPEQQAEWLQSVPRSLRFKTLTKLRLESYWTSAAMDIMLHCCPALVHLELDRFLGRGGTPQRRYDLKHLRTIVLTECKDFSKIFARLQHNPVEELTFDLDTVYTDYEEEEDSWMRGYSTAEYAYGYSRTPVPEQTQEIDDLDPESWLAAGKWPSLKKLKVGASTQEANPVDQAKLVKGTSEAVAWADACATILDKRGVEFQRCSQSLYSASDPRYKKWSRY